jgi:hypothetical protein
LKKKKPKYSKIAIRCLEEIKVRLKLPSLIHAKSGHGGEFSFKRYHFDGYCPEFNLILEFHGNLSHGNPLYFNPNDRIYKYGRNTAKVRYNRTLLRERILLKAGFNLCIIWQHEYSDRRLFYRFLRKVRSCLREWKDNPKIPFLQSSTENLPEQRKLLPLKLNIRKIKEF